MTESGRVVINGVEHEIGSSDLRLLPRSCVVSLEEVDGRSITTVEGLARDGVLHRVQQAFVDVGAMQCGFCTPGMVVAAVALLDTELDPPDDEIARWMAPNVCRCCTYPRIVALLTRHP